MSLATYTAAVLAAGPVAYYKLDDAGGLPADSSGSALNMTASSGAALYQQPGLFAPGSIFFPPATSFSRAVVSAATDNFTIELLINPVAYTTGFDWFYGDGTPAATNGFSVGFDAAGKMEAVAHNVGITTPSSASVPLNRWSHLVWQRSGGQWYYWINGLLDLTGGGSAAPGTASGSCFINATATGANTGRHQLAHLAIYDSVLAGYVVRAHAGNANAASDLGVGLSRVQPSSHRLRS